MVLTPEDAISTFYKSDIDILVLDNVGTYKQMKLSVYEELLHQEQLTEIKEIHTVIDGAPEAKRY